MTKNNQIALVRDNLRRRLILRDAYDDVVRDMTSRGFEVSTIKAARAAVADGIARQRDILATLEDS